MTIFIPKTFELAGRTWTVERVGKKKWFGQTRHNECLIQLSSRCKDDEELLHTFLHELTHAIAYTMGWNKFNDDEGKIDGFASLLMQTMVTAK